MASQRQQRPWTMDEILQNLSNVLALMARNHAMAPGQDEGPVVLLGQHAAQGNLFALPGPPQPAAAPPVPEALELPAPQPVPAAAARSRSPRKAKPSRKPDLRGEARDSGTATGSGDGYAGTARAGRVQSGGVFLCDANARQDAQEARDRRAANERHLRETASRLAQQAADQEELDTWRDNQGYIEELAPGVDEEEDNNAEEAPPTQPSPPAADEDGNDGDDGENDDDGGDDDEEEEEVAAPPQGPRRSTRIRELRELQPRQPMAREPADPRYRNQRNRRGRGHRSSSGPHFRDNRGRFSAAQGNLAAEHAAGHYALPRASPSTNRMFNHSVAGALRGHLVEWDKFWMDGEGRMWLPADILVDTLHDHIGGWGDHIHSGHIEDLVSADAQLPSEQRRYEGRRFYDPDDPAASDRLWVRAVRKTAF